MCPATRAVLEERLEMLQQELATTHAALERRRPRVLGDGMWQVVDASPSNAMFRQLGHVPAGVTSEVQGGIALAQAASSSK